MSRSDAAVFATEPATNATQSREREWVERARHGDHHAFAQLVDARLNVTFRSMMAVLGDEADARDAAQAAFIRAWQHLPGLRDPATFPAWFHRIVVNTARSTLATRRRHIVREVSIEAVGDEADLRSSPSDRHDDRVADLDRLERALDRLRPDDRLLLWLHHYEDLSLTEIGERLRVPSKTVKSRLFSARRALELALAREDA